MQVQEAVMGQLPLTCRRAGRMRLCATVCPPLSQVVEWNTQNGELIFSLIKGNIHTLQQNSVTTLRCLQCQLIKSHYLAAGFQYPATSLLSHTQCTYLPTHQTTATFSIHPTHRQTNCGWENIDLLISK